MPDDKVYTPEVIQENPFPGELVELPINQSDSVAGGNFKPTTTKDVKFARKKIAVELLSTALNTKSKKILQEFALEQFGGIKIGNFQEGLHGEITITPNGIVAKNQGGITTIAIDGDTGDTIFAGELRSGSIISGDVTLQEGAELLLNNGADIRLQGLSGNPSEILFYDDTKFSDVALSNRFYVDPSTGLHLDPSADERNNLGFGTSLLKYQGIELHSADGVSIRTENGGNYTNLITTSNRLEWYYNGALKARLDSNGDLYITGTITENHTF